LLTLSLNSFVSAEQSRPKLKIATSLGDMVFELYPDQSPQTIQHFLLNANQGIYDGTIFHKVVSDFVIQGGGFDVNFRERTVMKMLPHEGQESVTKGNLRNKYGVISLARGADRDSAGLEFFINVADNPDLDPVAIPLGDPIASFEYNGNTFKNVPRKDIVSSKQLWGFTPFASIVSGQAVLEKIRKTNTGALGPFANSVPVIPVVIQSVRLTFNPNNAFAIVPIASSTNSTTANILNVSNTTTANSATSSIAVTATAVVSSTENITLEVLAAVEKWADAWRNKNVDGYIASYEASFKTAKFKSHAEWVSFRKDRITEKSKISVKVVNPQVKLNGNKAEVKFIQQYSADGIISNTQKVLGLEKINNNWLIIKEDS
jgi:peptidyl-prolyl cis-trans isomerase A (cyclophilin A)